MRDFRFVAAVLFLTCIGNSSSGETRSPDQWQKLTDDENPVVYDPLEGSILGSLSHYSGKGQVHMVYTSEFPKTEMTIKFVRDGKEILVLNGHLHSVFRDSGDTLYFADFGPICTGCAVAAYDLKTGKQLWRTALQGIGPVGHSKYWNKVNMELDDGVVRIRGYEAFGSYVEIVNAETGKILAHRLTSRP